MGRWIGGGTPSKSHAAYWQGDIPWVSPKDMKVERVLDATDHISESAVDETATSLVPDGSVLVVTRSGILSHTLPVAVADRAVALNQDLKALVPARGLDPTYIAWALRAHAQRILATCSKSGTTVSNIETRRLLGFAVPLAPFAEQRRIVAAIEEQFSRLDAVDEILVTVQLRAEALRRATLNSHLSVISESRPLDDFATTQLGKMLSSKARTGTDPRPYLRNKNVRWYEFELDGLLEMDFDENERAKFALEPGDVVVCEGGEVGRAAVWRGEMEECYFQKAVHRVRTQDDLAPDFLVHVLRWFADTNAFERYITGSTINHLPQEDLRTLPIPAPPVEEQQRIVAEIEQQLSLINSLRAAVESAQKRNASLRRSILERAFRGELVPQDPEDEPASVLLERIRAERAAAPKPTRRRRVPA
jgi:type I restriction enzyme S subunit